LEDSPFYEGLQIGSSLSLGHELLQLRDGLVKYARTIRFGAYVCLVDLQELQPGAEVPTFEGSLEHE
jgi:hypothetical protein